MAAQGLQGQARAIGCAVQVETIIAEGIEDNPHNKTRFLVVGEKSADQAEAALGKIPDALREALGAGS